jgi:RNA polymerase sigma-54 factor
VTSMNLRAESRQAQKLSPRLQHAVRLLQMSSLDFSATVRDLLGRNPFLEAEEDEDGENVEALPTEASADGDAAANEVAVSEAIEGSAGESHDDDRDLWQADGASSPRGADDGELSALEKMAADTSLATHLHGQANLLGLSERALFMARAIIESLDDDGYLRTALEELVGLVPVTPSATLEEMERALTAVQSLEPAGVGARSVAECLLLQLPDIPCPNVRALARRIVEEQLPRLAARDVQGLAHALGEPVAMVEQVCDRIRRLDPRPGWRHGSSRVAYVVPDVIVRKVHNKWTVHLNPAVVPKVRLNHVYAELFKRHRSAGNADMAGQLQEARWTLRNVEQRFSTILDVAEAVVRRQHHFFEFGAMAMKPLGLKEIAEEVGIHESTVSRVTNNKYMATPCGVFELKYFFSRAMVSASGSACSGTAIRGLVKDIIEAERPESPLSDAEITRQLGRQGLVVARRTVTKYRQMLRIEAVERRRRHV